MFKPPILYSLISGVLIALSFPPFDVSFLIWIAFVPLFMALRQSKPKQIVALCFSTSVILTPACYYSVIAFNVWFFIVINLIGWVNFSVLGLTRHYLQKKYQNFWAQVFFPPAIWMAIEQLNTLAGIPYNIGISQYAHSAIIQLASIAGVFGISFLIIGTNTALETVIWHFFSREPEKRPPWTSFAGPVIFMALLFTGNFGYGIYVVSKPIEQSKSISIVTIQPVISSWQYRYAWIEPENRAFIRKAFDDLTREALKQKPDMVFWPEGGNGYFNLRIPRLRDHLYQIAKSASTDLIIGSDDIDEDGRRYNSVFSISPDGKLHDRHDKVALVPFQESQYTAGDNYSALHTSQGKFGVMICFESCFPLVSRELTANGAQILAVSSSDVIFRRTILANIHAIQSIFRAVENRRYLIRASNAGPSMIIDPHGKIQDQSRFFSRSILKGEVSAIDEKSIYTKWGYLIPILMIFSVAGICFHVFLSERGHGKREKAIKNKSQGKRKGSPKFVGKTKKDMPPQNSVVGFLGRINWKQDTLIAGVHLLIILILGVGSIAALQFRTQSGMNLKEALVDFIEPADKVVADELTEKFLQAQKNTCGPAALAYLMSFFGRETLEAEVVSDVEMQDRGTSMYELVEAAKKYGFDSWGEKQNYEALKQQPTPLIAFINSNHYVVVIRVNPYWVELFDPAIGHLKIKRRVFEKVWNGYVMLVRVKPIQEEGANLRLHNLHVFSGLGRLWTYKKRTPFKTSPRPQWHKSRRG